MKFKPTTKQLTKLEAICNILNELWNDCADNFNGDHFDAKDISNLSTYDTELHSLLNKWKARV